VRSTSDQRRASVSPRLRPVGASRRISGAYATGQWRCRALLSSAYLPFDPGGRVVGEQFGQHRRLKFAMASMGKSETKVSELCKEFGISRQTFYRHVSVNGEACPDGVRVLSRKERRSLPWNVLEPRI
jgi:hypothetical protein